jgi:hypothetical protein
VSHERNLFAVTDITHWLPDGTGTCFAGKAPSVQFPISSFQVFRGNRMRSDGGIVVEHLAEDILLEDNRIANSDKPVSVDSTCRRVYSRINN